MNSFLVLGQIPGTNYQISFQTWLAICALVAGFAIITRFSLRVGFLSDIGRMLRRSAHGAVIAAEIELLVQTRKPLNASQLHQRAQ